MITSSKVLRFHEKCDCRLDDMPLAPLKDDELQCKAVYSAVSIGSDKISYVRDFPKTMHRQTELGQPITYGYSMAAEVIAVGKNVKDYKVGDRIYTWQNHRQYFNVEPDSIGDPSPRKEYWRYTVAKIPDNVEMIEACYMTIMRCALFACMKAEIKITDTVIVMGLGTYGLFALQFAKIMGARRVIAIDPIPERAERAKQFGADLVFAKDAADMVPEIEELTGGKMADALIDASNSYKGITAGADLLRGEAKLVIIGDPLRADLMIFSDRVRRAHIDIRGIWIDMMTSNWPQPFYPITIEDIHTRIFELIAQKRLKVKELITDIVNPENANEMYSAMLEDCSKSCGVVYDWSQLKD